MSGEEHRSPASGPAQSKLAILVSGAAFAVLLATAGWWGTDQLEQRNEFCNACHLDGWFEGTPMHTVHRDQFAERAPTSLAAAHAVAGNDARLEDPAFRCIDCHGGVGFLGKARVKALAAKDLFSWVVGDFEEPEGMHWPLREDDCRQCHSRFDVKAGEFDDPAFHDLGVHNQDLGIDCAECHTVHEIGVDSNRWFLNASDVRQQCARCHSEMAE